MKKRRASRSRNALKALCVVVLLLAPGSALAAGTWGGGFSLSGWLDMTEIYKLLYAEDGTVAAIWLDADAVTKQYSFWGRVRPPGGAWSAAANITGWRASMGLQLDALCMEITPDGTPWLLWMEQDKTKPAPNIVVKCAHADASGAWHAENLSDAETEVRTANLAVGPDGRLAAVWASCSTVTADPWLGSCQVNVRLRPAGTWLAAEAVDAGAGVGIVLARAQAGPAGLTSVTWAEVKPASATEWKIVARAHTPGAGWDALPTDVTGWLEPREADSWIGWPAMGEDGTEILVWTVRSAPGAAFDALYSSTRGAVSGNWSVPAKISTDRPANAFGTPQLATRDGTALVGWTADDGAGVYEAVFVNSRAPLGVWGAEQQLSTWRYAVTLQDVEIWPQSGDCIALWQEEDDTRAGTEDEGLFWSSLSPGGSWTLPNQLGAWVESMLGAGIEVWTRGGQGAADVVWCALDAALPANQQAVAYTASRQPGSAAWTSPRVLTSGQYRMAMMPWDWGMRVDASGLPVCAALLVRRYVTPPASPFGIQFFEKEQRAPAWLPLFLEP